MSDEGINVNEVEMEERHPRGFGPVPEGREVPTVSVLPAGTVWQCECDRVWVVEYVPPYSTGRAYMAGGNRWRAESRRERRRRLGLRWWQREAR